MGERPSIGAAARGNGHDGTDGTRLLAAQAFSKLVEAQKLLQAADMAVALYMLDAVKLTIAKRAASLMDKSARLESYEAEMVRWLIDKDDEETERLESPPEAS